MSDISSLGTNPILVSQNFIPDENDIPVDQRPAHYANIAANLRELVAGSPSLDENAAKTLLEVISHLESKGVTDLGALKVQINTKTVKPPVTGLAASKPLPDAPVSGLQHQAAPSGPVISEINTTSVLGDLMVDENPLATKTEAFIKSLVPTYHPAEFLAGFMALNDELKKSAEAQKKIAIENGTTVQDLPEFTQKYLQEAFSALTNDELKALANILSGEDLKNLISALRSEGQELYFRHLRDVVKVSCGINILRAIENFSEYKAALKNVMDERLPDYVPEPQALTFEAVDEANEAEVKAFLPQAEEAAEANIFGSMNNMLDDILASQDNGGIIHAIGEFKKNFSGATSPTYTNSESFKAFVTKSWRDIAAQTEPAVLKQIVARLQEEPFATLSASAQNTSPASDIKEIKSVFEGEQIKRATAALPKNIEVHGLTPFNYVVPSFSKWDNFKRAISNFFATIFTFKAHHSLNEEQMIKRAKEFGQEYGHLMWQMSDEGFQSLDIQKQVASELSAHNPNMTPKEAQKMARTITQAMISGGTDWCHKHIGDFSKLPDDDLRRALVFNDLVSIADGLGIKLDYLTPEEATGIKEKILLYIKEAESKPDFSAATVESIVKDSLTEVAKVNHLRLLGLTPAEPESLQNTAAWLINATSQHLPNIGKFLAIATKLEIAVHKEADAKFQQKRLAKPDCTPPGRDDYKAIRQETFNGLISQLNDTQLIHLMKMADTKDFKTLATSLDLFTDDLSGQGIYGDNAVVFVDSLEEIMTGLYEAAANAVINRGLDAGIPNLESELNFRITKANIPAHLKEPMIALNNTVIDAGHIEARERLDGIFETITQGSIGHIQFSAEGNLVLQLKNLRAWTHTSSTIPDEVQAFNDFFNNLLSEDLPKMSKEDFSKLLQALEAEGITSLHAEFADFMQKQIDGELPPPSHENNMAHETLKMLETAVQAEKARREASHI